MNAHTPFAPTLSTSNAQLRLAQSRVQIARWLEQEPLAPTASSVLGCAVRSALPLLGALRAHTGTSVVLGALAQAWLRSSGPAPSAGDSALRPLELAVSLARRRPMTTLIAVAATGLALWWRFSSRHPTPRSIPHPRKEPPCSTPSPPS